MVFWVTASSYSDMCAINLCYRKWESERREAAGCAAANTNKAKAAGQAAATARDCKPEPEKTRKTAAGVTENTNKRQAAGRAAENATTWELSLSKLWQLWSEHRDNHMEAAGRTVADAKKKITKDGGELRRTPRSKLYVGTCRDTLSGGGRGGTNGLAERAWRLEETATSESNGTGTRGSRS